MRIAMIGQKGIVTGGRSGGIERHVREISKRLAFIGHDIFVYARAKYDPAKPSHYKGVKLIFLPTVYLKHLEAIIHTFFCTIHALFQDYDVIHYHGVGPATLAWIPKVFSRSAKVVITFHSQDRFHKKWGFFARLYLYFGEWASVMFSDYCITVSHEMQVFCRKRFGKQAVYIPNGANLHIVKDNHQLEKFGITAGEYFLTVGRIVPQKGLQFLIKAFKEIDTKKAVVIVGAPSFSSHYYKDLRELARLDQRIHFVGFQEGETLDQLYAHAYAYVHPSEYEGLPLVILEAMSFGKMPIVSDIAPNVEAVHEIGVTFETGNVDDLREKLRFAISHPSFVRDQSEQARAIIETHYDWDTITDRIEAVYITSRH